MNFPTPGLGLKSPGLRNLGLKTSWLKSLGVESPGLKGLGLKLGVEKSGVEMSFNPWYLVATLLSKTHHNTVRWFEVVNTDSEYFWISKPNVHN